MSKGITVGILLLGLSLFAIGLMIVKYLGKQSVIGWLVFSIGFTLITLFMALAAAQFVKIGMQPLDLSDKNTQEKLSIFGELVQHGVVCPKCDKIYPAGKITCDACGAGIFDKHQPIRVVLLGIVLGLAGWLWDNNVVLFIGIAVTICGLGASIFVQGYHAWALGKYESEEEKKDKPLESHDNKSEKL